MHPTILSKAKSVFEQEATALQEIIPLLDEQFTKVVTLIHKSNGRLVISGIGKSAIIAQKLSATFNSTGTPSLFMHAADAIHGDLGMIQERDIVIIISKSGTSPEVKALVPSIRKLGNSIIALSGNPQGYLAQNSDYFLNTWVSAEACPNNLAPTTSTTAQLVMGDALAICLLDLNGFEASDFAMYHPGGALGKQLYLMVDDLMKENQLPVVTEQAQLSQIIYEISSKRLGATTVVNNKKELVGIITDGDLRRMLEKGIVGTEICAKDIMTQHPKFIESGHLAVKALDVLKSNNITQLPVVKDNTCVGMIHIHDLVREGIV